MREIGGYIELERFSGDEFYPEAIPLNSCRNAMLYLLQLTDTKRLLMPHYNCGEVSLALEKQCSIDFYYLDSDFMPLLPDNIDSYDMIMLINPFDHLSDEYIGKLAESYSGHIMVDNTQAFFRKPAVLSDRVHYVYSCRKFFGVPDGGYLYTHIKERLDIPKDKSAERCDFLLGRMEDTASEHYSQFRRNEEYIEQSDMLYMSDITRNILRAIDYDYVKRKRNDNYLILEELLGDENIFPKLDRPNGPYIYPFYTEKAMQIRPLLAKQGIYIPLLWPNTAQLSEDSVEYRYSANVLVLPCDQRYNRDDMQYMVDLLKKHLEEL